MASRTDPATVPVTWPPLVNGAALPASRTEPPLGAAPAGPLQLTIVMAATVAVAVARLMCLRLLDTRSPRPRTHPKLRAHGSVIRRRTRQKPHDQVTIQERAALAGCYARSLSSTSRNVQATTRVSSLTVNSGSPRASRTCGECQNCSCTARQSATDV